MLQSGILIPCFGSNPSFGQTYEDIVSIDSKEQFIRIGIENNYEINFMHFQHLSVFCFL